MKKAAIVIYVVGVIAIILAIWNLTRLTLAKANQKVDSVVEQVIQKEIIIPTFKVVSTIVKTHAIEKIEESSVVLGFIPDGYSILYEYDLLVFIGSNEDIKPEVDQDQKRIKIVLPELKVISIEKSSPKLITAFSKGYSWFAGKGIPIQDILNRVLDMESIRESYNKDEIIMKEARANLMLNVSSFYSFFKDDGWSIVIL